MRSPFFVFSRSDPSGRHAAFAGALLLASSAALSFGSFGSLGLLGSLGIAGCVERRFAGPPPPESSPPPVAVASIEDAGAEEETTSPRPLTWLDAMRLERWSEAAALIDALPDAARDKPEMIYARARAAVGAGDGARALTLLEGLEVKLPLVAADLERWRAEAQLMAGPFANAAAYFARSRSARDLVKAASAYRKAGDLALARSAVERALGAISHAKGSRDEAIVRAERVEITRAQSGVMVGDAAAEADLRWLAAHAASSVEGRAAIAALDRMKRGPSPSSPSSSRATEPAPVVVGDGPSTPGVADKPARPLTRGEALHAKAMGLFHARDYLAAATTFREAAAAASGHEAEDLHYAAKSLARADRDKEAVTAYRAVAARFPRSAFAEKSELNAARLLLQDGSFRLASEAYSRFLATHGKADHREEAEYERALAWLSGGAPAEALKALTALAKRASDDKAARLRELAGVAADRAGDRPGAIAAWTEVAHKAPLSWAALMSRARLAEVGAPLPAVMDPAPMDDPARAASRPPLALRLPATPLLLASVGLDGDAETYLSTTEREATAPYPGRESEALCGLYGMLSRARRRYKVGVVGVEGSWLQRTPMASERWAWDCVYPRPFAVGVRALEALHGLPRGLVHAVMRQESAFDPAVVSAASAVGLMQLIPSTARQAAAEIALPPSEIDLTRPDVNLRLGAFYIAKLLKMFGGNVALAAAAYNAGPRAVSHWIESAIESAADNDLDLWVARIPYEETRTYVARVAQNMARYQWLEGGNEAVAEVALTLPEGVRAPPDAY